MPVNKLAIMINVTDKRIWQYYVQQSMNQLCMDKVTAIAVDETANKRVQRYITVFLDMERKEHPVFLPDDLPQRG